MKEHVSTNTGEGPRNSVWSLLCFGLHFRCDEKPRVLDHFLTLDRLTSTLDVEPFDLRPSTKNCADVDFEHDLEL